MQPSSAASGKETGTILHPLILTTSLMFVVFVINAGLKSWYICVVKTAEILSVLQCLWADVRAGTYVLPYLLDGLSEVF